MKKLIIGLAAGAMALGASVIPASAGNGPYSADLPYSTTTDSMWGWINDGIVGTAGALDSNDDGGYAEQLVLLAGLSNTLDQCGNGKTLYTLFLPTEYVLTQAIEVVLDTSVAELAAAPAAVKAILSDHLVAGAVDPALLSSQPAGIKKLVAVSGYTINIRVGNTIIAPYGAPTYTWTDIYANGFQLVGATLACNGWIYSMLGMFQQEDFLETFGTNNLPPTGSAVSELPDTL